MGAPSSRKDKPRGSRTIGVTPDTDLLSWLEERMGPGERWSGPTHFFNWAVKHAMAEEEELTDILKSDQKDALLSLLGHHSRVDPKKKG